MFWTRWAGWDHVYNTREPPENILDDSLIADFRAGRDVTADLEGAVYHFRNEIAAETMKKKGAEGAAEVCITSVRDPAVAHALLARFRHAPSRLGKKPLPLEIDKGERQQTTSLELSYLEDIGGTLMLELVRPEHAFAGCLLKKGKTSTKKLFTWGPPFVLRCAPAARRAPRAAPC